MCCPGVVPPLFFFCSPGVSTPFIMLPWRSNALHYAALAYRHHCPTFGRPSLCCPGTVMPVIMLHRRKQCPSLCCPGIRPPFIVLPRRCSALHYAARRTDTLQCARLLFSVLPQRCDALKRMLPGHFDTLHCAAPAYRRPSLCGPSFPTPVIVRSRRFRLPSLWCPGVVTPLSPLPQRSDAFKYDPAPSPHTRSPSCKPPPPRTSLQLLPA